MGNGYETSYRELADAQHHTNMLQVLAMAEIQLEGHLTRQAVNQNGAGILAAIGEANAGMRGIGAKLDGMERSIRGQGIIANNQRYAQWRDGTENGQFYHYTYRPQALKYVDNYRLMSNYWVTLVQQVVQRKINDFVSWKRPEWLDDGILTGVFYPADFPPEPPQQLWEDREMVRNELQYVEAGKGVTIGPAALGAFFGFLVGAALAVVLVLASDLSEILLLAGITVFFASPIAGIFIASKIKDKERESRRQRLFDWHAEIEQSLAHWQDVRRNWEAANAEASEQCISLVSEAIGVNLRSDFTESWASTNERNTAGPITDLLKNALEAPPARDTLVPPGSLEFNQNLPEWAAHNMSTVRYNVMQG